MWWLHTTLSFTSGLQIRAIVPSTKSKQLYKGAQFQATEFTYLCKYDDYKKY